MGLFLKFESQEARRASGGSCFIEIQYCSLPAGTPTETLVDIDSLHHWDLTSLYIPDEEMSNFYLEYRGILRDGYYGNHREGVVDSWGINYYNPQKTRRILRELSERRPRGYEILVRWLSGHQNGFYILGV